MLCYVMLCYVMLCYVMLCYVMLCYVMLYYIILYYIILYYIILYYIILYYKAVRSYITQYPILGLHKCFIPLHPGRRVERSTIRDFAWDHSATLQLIREALLVHQWSTSVYNQVRIAQLNAWQRYRSNGLSQGSTRQHGNRTRVVSIESQMFQPLHHSAPQNTHTMT